MTTAETRQAALLFYPLLRLSRACALSNGDIGPIRALADKYQLPAPLVRHCSQYRVDDEPIKYPSGAFGWEFDALRKEMEIVTYVADLRYVDAVEEIFSQRVDIRFDRPPGRG